MQLYSNVEQCCLLAGVNKAIARMRMRGSRNSCSVQIFKHRTRSPIWRAICRFVLPEALSRIILARLTSLAGRDRELAMPSSCSRCSGRRTKAAFGRPIAIDTPILHWRYRYSQQYYCHLFMGQTLVACQLSQPKFAVGG